MWLRIPGFQLSLETVNEAVALVGILSRQHQLGRKAKETHLSPSRKRFSDMKRGLIYYLTCVSPFFFTQLQLPFEIFSFKN